MLEYKEINLEFQNRTNVFNLIDSFPGEPEMTEFESAFISGIVKKIKP
jgi:hypothetical protein